MEVRSLSVLFLAVAMPAFTANTWAQPPQEQSPAAQHSTGTGMMQNCPMKLQGADLQVSDTADGIQLAITTKSGDVAELRRRVEAMAQMHGAAAGGPMMHGPNIPFTAKLEEIANGAQLTLTPKDPARLDEFRVAVRQHAEQMKQGNCTMMQGMMQHMMQGTPGSKNTTGDPADDAPKADVDDHSAHHPDGK